MAKIILNSVRTAGLRRRWLDGAAAIALAVTSGALVSPAAAQQAASPAAAGPKKFELEEIVVTSRRFEESVQDAPVTVNVMSSDFIENQRVVNFVDIIQLTPGATFDFFSKANPATTMRGVVSRSPGAASDEASIQTVVDGVVIAKEFMKNPNLYDVDRVEVLRGPQGISFGRNASIGLVHIISKRPTQEFEAGATGTVGNGERFETDGYVSGPLTETLSARFAYNFDHNDGDTEEVSSGKGIDGQENFAFRGSLLYEPRTDLSIYLKAEYSEDNDEAPVRRSGDCSIPQTIAAGDPLRALLNVSPNHPPFTSTNFDPCDPFKADQPDENFFAKRDILSLTGEVAWDISDALTLTSITAWWAGEGDGVQNALGTVENLLFQRVKNDAEFFTQEIRIDNSASADRMRWLAGVYFLSDQHSRLEENRWFRATPDKPVALPFPRVPTLNANLATNHTNSIAFFGETTYEFTDKFSATFGARWNRDSKEGTFSGFGFGFAPLIAGLTGCTTSPVCGSEANPAGFDPVPVGKNFDDAMFKGSLEYRVTDDHMVYFLVSQGFKSGGFQPDARTPETAQIAFGPERSINYEVGWKGEFANRFRFGLVSFFLKNDNTQLTQLVPVGQGFVNLFSNAGRVESFGVEGDATWLVTPDFRVSGTFSAIHVRLKDTALPLVVGQPPRDFSNTRPEDAPKWTGTFVGEYDVHLPDQSTLTLRADWQGRSNNFDDLGEEPDRKRPQLSILNARVTWTEAEGHLSFSAWGKNLFEDEDITNIGPRQTNTIQLPLGFGLKRTFGGTLSYRY